MNFVFFNAAGQTLFSRSDAETAHWIQHEMTFTADFPFDPNKKIEIGQRIAYRDGNTLNVFEVRQCTETEPDHGQRVTAESIAISELSDEHIDKTEITNKTAAEALTTVLTGTLWALGTNTASGTQSVDIARGDVWQAVNAIKTNWNVYVTPRMTFSAAGAITGRYLDITPAGGVWNGLRLSVRRDFLDPSVTYNDADVYTALYGYGASKKDTDLTFKDEVWTATAEHPAKPANQTYLEDPAATALYGRNGRARFGYYQNASITDPAVLLQKTWEALQRCNHPKISISGTAIDLYRLGYKGEPLKLHDLVLVEIAETGETFYKEIIMLDIDLIDPTNNRVDIGDYLPNIIYINRDTAKKSRGGGGGGGVGQTPNEAEQSKTFAEFAKTNDMIGMVVGERNGGYYVKAAEIVLSINQNGGTNIKLKADTIDIDGVVRELNASQVTLKDVLIPTALLVTTGDVNFTSGGRLQGTWYIGTADCTALSVDNQSATWKSQSVLTNINLTGSFSVVDTNGVTHTIKAISTASSTTSKTINYLGR